jgi:hypothetical protein
VEVSFRRYPVVAARSSEGLLSDYTVGIQPAQRELVFMPLTGPRGPGPGIDEVGYGKPIEQTRAKFLIFALI